MLVASKTINGTLIEVFFNEDCGYLILIDKDLEYALVDTEDEAKRITRDLSRRYSAI